MKSSFTTVLVIIALVTGGGVGYFFAMEKTADVPPKTSSADDNLPDPLQVSREFTAKLQAENDDLKRDIKALEDARVPAKPEPDPDTENWKSKYADAEAARAKAESEIIDLKAKLESAKKPEVEPESKSTMYVDWGKYNKIEGFANADWKDLGDTYTKIMAKMDQMREAFAKGETPSTKLQQEVRKINEKLIDHYIGIVGKVPTEMPRANGEFTHPANLVNILAGQLDSAGNPLSEGQLNELKILAEEYDSKWAKAEAQFTDDTWRLEKLQTELKLKEWFKAEMFKVTTPAQKELALAESLDGLLGFDLYSAGLMLQGLAQQINAETQADLRTQLKAAIVKATKLSSEQVESANYIFDAWIFAVQDQMGPFTEAELNLRYTADLIKALDAEVVALKALYNDIANTDEERESISTQFAIAQLRLKKTD